MVRKSGAFLGLRVKRPRHLKGYLFKGFDMTLCHVKYFQKNLTWQSLIFNTCENNSSRIVMFNFK